MIFSTRCLAMIAIVAKGSITVLKNVAGLIPPGDSSVEAIRVCIRVHRVTLASVLKAGVRYDPLFALFTIQVLAWRADPSTADQANEVWSSLASTNTTIAALLNALATAAASSSCEEDTGDQSFEASMKVLLGYCQKSSKMLVLCQNTKRRPGSLLERALILVLPPSLVACS